MTKPRPRQVRRVAGHVRAVPAGAGLAFSFRGPARLSRDRNGRQLANQRLDAAHRRHRQAAPSDAARRSLRVEFAHDSPRNSTAIRGGAGVLARLALHHSSRSRRRARTPAPQGSRGRIHVLPAQRCVTIVADHQLGRRALLDDLPAIQHQHQVGIANRAQAMRDDEARAAGDQP